jgi:hypothetical protein
MRAIHVEQSSLWPCIGYIVVDAGKRRNAEQAPPVHKGPWPIRDGRNYQPTENELRALHLQDVTPDEAREIDRLYNQLLAADPANTYRSRGGNRS